MKFGIVSLLTLTILTSPLLAEMRIFVSPDGRAIEAEILAATPDTVTLKFANGQSIVTPVTKFSTQDQQFIADWLKQNPPTIKYAFTTNYTKDKKSSVKRSSGNKTFTTDTWVCNMKIANRSGMTLENVKVNYDIYYNEAQGTNTVVRKASGSTTIPTIKHLQELVVPTNELKLESSQLEGGYYYSDGSRSRQRDTLSGMAIKISHQGKDVYSWASGGVPASREATAEGKGSLFSE